MNRKNLFSFVAAIAVMFAATGGAEAQNVLQRARDAVQNTANKTGTHRNPSAEAVAADPRASIDTPEEGYTRTPAQIRASYEALDKGKFFHPYYHPNLRRYYLLDDSKQEQDFFLNSAKTLDRHWCKARVNHGLRSYVNEYKILLTTSEKVLSYGHFTIVDTIPAGNRSPWGCDDDDCIGVMPVGVHVIYAGFALFKADPEGLKPFMRFCEAENAYLAFRGTVNVNGGPDGRTIRDNPNKLAVQWKNIAQLKQMESDLEASARSISMNVIHDAASYYRDQVAKYDAAKDVGNSRFYFHLFETAMYYWQESRNKSQLKKEMDALYADYVKFTERYKAWMDADK